MKPKRTVPVAVEDRAISECKLRYAPQGEMEISTMSGLFFLLASLGLYSGPGLVFLGLVDHSTFGVYSGSALTLLLLLCHGPLLLCRRGDCIDALQKKTSGRLFCGWVGCAYRTSFRAEATFHGKAVQVRAMVLSRYLQPWLRCSTVVEVSIEAAEPLVVQSNESGVGRHADRLEALRPAIDLISRRHGLIQIMVLDSRLRVAIHGREYNEQVGASAAWLAFSAREVIEQGERAAGPHNGEWALTEPLPKSFVRRFGSIEEERGSPFLRHWFYLRQWSRPEGLKPLQPKGAYVRSATHRESESS